MVYGDSPRLSVPQYVSLRTSARGEPATAEIRISRGISTGILTGRYTVRIHVKNDDKSQSEINNIIVADTLPLNFEYEWNSATYNNGIIWTTGANPYFFQIGSLKFQEEGIIKYHMIPIEAA